MKWVVGIVILVIMLAQDVEKRKKEAVKKWDGIHIGMTKDAVIRRLGQPHRIWQAGSAEIMAYGSCDSDGQIRLRDGKVLAYEKPT